MNRTTFTLLAATAALALGLWPLRAEEKAHKLTTVSTRKMADSLHAIIAADQQAYAEFVAKTKGSFAALPSHAQLLRQAAQSIQKKGAEFSYTLRSLTPINANNGPQTEGEQLGLAAVAKQPGEAYYTEEELGGRSYFTAVYAEHATISSCVECHNQHPGSPRRDWKPGDVMGAVVVRVPLEF
jgi:hypothetical protein